jgi:hypothetical protein
MRMTAAKLVDIFPDFPDHFLVEHSTEPYGSVKVEEILDQLSDYQLLIKASVPRR